MPDEQKFHSLDGLRAIFLLWVLFVHAPDSAIPWFLKNAHAHWVLGVDGFLAISGFLILRSLQRCTFRAKQIGKPPIYGVYEFLVRRFSRTIPPYYLILGLILSLALFSRNGLYENLISSWKGSLGFPFFYANYSIPIYPNTIPALLQPFWSISFQEQFYFLLALVSVGLGFTRKLKIFLLASGLLSICLRIAMVTWIWKGQSRGWEYEANLHLAFDSMSWGCLAWLSYDQIGWLWKTPSRSRFSNLVILTLLAAAVSARSLWYSQDSMGILSIARAPLLALFVRMVCEAREGVFVKFLQANPTMAMGKISYEVYLISPLVYAVLDRYSDTLGLGFLPLALFLVLPIGFLFHKCIGRPSHQWLLNKWHSSGSERPEPACLQGLTGV